MMDVFTSELEQNLQQIVAPTYPGSVKDATVRLRKQFYSRKEIVPALIHLMQMHNSPQIRQIAGVEVRKLISQYWRVPENGLSEATMEEIQNSLLASTMAEKNDLVRHTSSRVISHIAITGLEHWPQLLSSLVVAAHSSKASEREVAIYIIYTLVDLETLDVFTRNTDDILRLLSETLRDKESLAVRVSSVLALCKISEVLVDNKAQAFQEFIPGIVEVLNQTVTAGDEKSALQVFGNLSDLVLGDPALLGSYLPTLIEHMMTSYAVPESVDPEYRCAALQFISNVARYRQKKLQALKLGPTLIRACVQIVSEPFEDDDDDDDDGYDDTVPSYLALRIIETLACVLPPSQGVAPLIEVLPSLLTSGNEVRQRAAYLALSVSIEGAPDYINSEIERVLPPIMQGLNSNVLLVKMAALQALSTLASEIPSVVGPEHALLLPLVFSAIDSANSLKMARLACLTLNTILGSLEHSVITENYLSSLVPKLLSLIEHTQDLDLKGSVVNCLASAAFAAGRCYEPYFAETVQSIQKFIVVPKTGEEMDSKIARLCGITLDALGSLCTAVGKDTFRPFLNASLETVYSFAVSSVSELKECAFVFIGTIAAVYTSEFAPYVPKFVPIILDTFKQLEFNADDLEDEDEDAVGANDDDDDILSKLKVNSGVALEKEFACDSLGEIIKVTPPEQFQQFLAPTLDVLFVLGNHFYEEIRRSAIIATWQLFISFYGASHGIRTWQPGFPCVENLSDIVAKIGADARRITFEILPVEDEESVVATVFDSLIEAIRKCGPATLGTQADLESLMNMVSNVLLKISVCQSYDEDDEELDGDNSENSEALIDYAMDVAINIAGALGQQFVPLFPTVAGLFRKYTCSALPSERTLGVGAMAELVGKMGPYCSQWTNDLIMLFGQALGDKKLAVRSVAAFGMGLLCFYSDQSETIKVHYSEILGKLQGLLRKVEKAEHRRLRTEANEEEAGNDTRSLANACGCVARMALKHPEAVPLNQVIPVLLSRLPLFDAYEENSPIFELLAKLAEQQNVALLENGNDLLRVLVSIGEQEAKAVKLDSLTSVGGARDPHPLFDTVARESVMKLVKFVESAQPGTIAKHPVLAELQPQ